MHNPSTRGTIVTTVEALVSCHPVFTDTKDVEKGKKRQARKIERNQISRSICQATKEAITELDREPPSSKSVRERLAEKLQPQVVSAFKILDRQIAALAVLKKANYDTKQELEQIKHIKQEIALYIPEALLKPQQITVSSRL